MKKVNPFIYIKQFYYSDSEFDDKGEVTSHGDINWWVDEEDLADFKEMWEEQLASGEIKLLEERSIKGVDYNIWLIGNSFGDHEGKYVDEECPLCEELLVNPECSEQPNEEGDLQRVQPTGNERFCSNVSCDYQNDDHINYWESEEDYWHWIGKQPPTPKFREPGQTFEEFCEKYKFEHKPGNICIVCKNIVPHSDFYRTKHGAWIIYEHDGCTNKGPSTFRPLGKEAEKWNSIL